MLERDKFYWLATSVVLTAVSVRASMLAVEDVSVPELISQLGHDNYLVRHAASEKPGAIGEPVLPGLNRAVTAKDPEVRWRAAVIRQQVIGRLAIARVEGSWETPKGDWLRIADGQWFSGTPKYGPFLGNIRYVKSEGTILQVNLFKKK